MSHITAAAQAALAQLTVRGREFMTFVGQHGFDFFDGGIVAGEGNWGGNMSWQLASMTGTSDRSSNGVMVATQKLGLWETSEDDGQMWWALTEVGAEIANHLAAKAAPAEPVMEVKRGRKWTYLHIDGVQVLEVRTELADKVLATFGL